MEENVKKIFVTGHRNPDIDTLASSYALAELRRRQGVGNIQSVCPGIMPERAKYLFERFHLPVPESRSDVYLRFSDIMETDTPTITEGTPLLEAVHLLNKSGSSRLPVIDRGVKTANFKVLRVNIPAVLIEAGFLSNPEEEKAANSPARQLAAATAIAGGIADFASRNTTGSQQERAK